MADILGSWRWLLLLSVVLLVMGRGCKSMEDDDAVVDDDSAGDDDGPAQVEILRDEFGIPHIYGDDLPAALYGFGYAQAEDHLSFMLVHYLAADGRLATALEEGDPDLEQAGYSNPLDWDLRSRLVRARAEVDDRWDQMDDHDDPQWEFSTTELLTAFAAGINDYMGEHPEEVPSWWSGSVEPQSVAAWMRLFLFNYQLGLISEKLAGIEERSGTQESNEWVVGPDKTDDGSVYVQSDPHLGWRGMTLWYEAHVAGGPMDMAGATLYGLPLIVMGHSDRLAFTETSNAMDNADLFEVPVSATDAGRYLYGDDELPFVFEEATVELAGGGTHTFEMAWTHHGPVVYPSETSDFSDQASVIVGAGTLWGQVHHLTQFLQMNLAQDVHEWREAMQPLQLQRWNFVVGDVDGNIFYVSNSRHPDRDGGQDWDTAVDGSDPALDWTASEPWAFDELAQATNPEAGFLQNCNDSPGWATPTYGDPIDESQWPDHYFNHDALGPRGRRALQQLDQEAPWTFEALQELSMDRYMLPAEWYVTTLGEGYALYGGGPDIDDPQALATAAAIFDGWDFYADTDSVAMTLFVEWAELVSGSISLSSPPPPDIDPETMVAALNALGYAVRALEDQHGTAQVPWGDVHRIRRGDVDLPIGGGPSGSLPSLFLTSTTEEEGGIGYAGQGSSYMLLTRFAPDGTVSAVSIKPWGNSENPDSPHYNDLTELFAQSRYKEFWYYREDVEAHLESAMTLSY